MIKTNFPQKISKEERANLEFIIEELFENGQEENYIANVPDEPGIVSDEEYDAWQALVDKLVLEKQKLMAQELIKIVTKKFKL